MALGYVAGASVVSIEGCGWIDASGRPNSIASELDGFGRLLVSTANASQAGGLASGGLAPSRRGVPDATLHGVALILPPDLGWSERPSYAAAAPTLWSYANIPTSARQGAAAVDGLLSAAYPGIGGVSGFLAFPFGAFEDGMHPAASPFARSAVAPPYAPDASDVFYAQPNLPFGHFHDRDQLHEWFRQGHRDPAPHRPMADTRWGDLLDVLVADHSRWADALLVRQNYSAVVWANTSMPPQARDTLHSYAEKGGVVVVAVGAVSADEVGLTGLVPTGELRAVRAWHWSPPTGQPTAEGHASTHGTASTSTGTSSSTSSATHIHVDHFLTAIAELRAPSAQVLAVSEPEGWPLIVRHPIGRGHVYTVLQPWFGANQLAPPALRLLDHVLAPIQPVSLLEGVPALYWTSTVMADGGGRVAAISNNAGARWVGKVRIRVGDSSSHAAGTERACTQPTCSDVWAGHAITCSLAATPDAGGFEAVDVTLTIDQNDVLIIKATCN
jgi:hypothetical protein